MTRSRRILAAIAALVGAPLAVAIVAIVACAVFGVTIDASRWRDGVAERATAALGRQVILEGRFDLTLGRDVALRLGGVRVLNPPGFPVPDFVNLGEMRVRFDLLDALRGRPSVRSVEATDVRLWLERAADGRSNWTLARPNDSGAPAVAPEVGRIVLKQLAIHYHDARTATRHALALDELTGSGGWNDPLRVTLRGRAGNGLPYAVELEGGPLGLVRDQSGPWPFKLDFEASGTRLHASGAVDAGSGEARFEFGGGTEDLAQVARLLDAKLPHFEGAAALYGDVIASTDAVELIDLRGNLGESAFSGHLDLALGGVRPRINGALTLATLDLRALFPADPASGHDKREDTSLRDLVPVDVNLDLRVERWLGLPTDLRDARLELQVDASGVRAPIGATLAGIPLSGHLELDTAAPTPTLAVQIDAKNSALGDLTGFLEGATGITGTLGRAGLRIGGRGETLDALVRDLELALSVGAGRLRYGNFAGGRSIDFTLDALDLVAGRGEPLRGRARGTLLGERATLSIRGGTLPQMLRERAVPVELDVAAAHAKLRIAGTLARPGAIRDTDLEFSLQARRSGDLARWLDVSPKSNLPVALRGRARIADDAWRFHDVTFRIGHSEVTVDARRTGLDAGPVIVAAVRSPFIDVRELATLRARTGTGGTAGTHIDAVLLPRGVALADADIEFELKRVALTHTNLNDIGFAAHMRAGRMSPSTIAGKLGGVPFEGLLALDLRGEVPEAQIELSAVATDIGLLLREMGAADDIDGRADALHVNVVARGHSLRELAGNSAFEARAVGGSITVRGATERSVAEIRVTEATIGARAGEGIRARLDGTLDETPVAIEVASGTLADFALGTSRVPLAVAANGAGAHLTLEGELALPLGRAGQVIFEAGGERLDTLNGLARVELPPWGPWSIRGPVRIAPTGYDVKDLLVRVGDSRLSGTGRLDIAGRRPHLEVRVTAPTIQLDDFPLPQHLAEESATTAEGLRATARNVAGQTERLLGSGFLRRLDADFDVEVREVLSGTDRLGDGALRAKISDGRLYLNPVQVNLPGGTMRVSISYYPTASEVELGARAYVEKFDYGILARRLGGGDDVRGLFSLNLDLAGRAPSLDAIMSHADGTIDFAVWPTDLRGGIFNFWSLNLLIALLPVIDPGGISHVNCVVGRFDLADGVLADDRIMIDTTRVRVRGAGSANLRTEEIDFVFRPRAKGLALFRLQNPLRVTGTFTDYHIGIDHRDLLGSTLRMLASPILVPWEWLTRGPMPRDGADVCTDPLRANDPTR